MSACGKTALLDALCRDELPASQSLELRAHAAQCARCRHELNWLESEAALFRQRASRDEVRHLWEGVALSSKRTDDARRTRRVLVSLAASLLLVVGLSRLAPSPPHATGGHDAAVEAWSAELASEALSSQSAGVGTSPMCSQLPEGWGFWCGPAVPASFVASR